MEAAECLRAQARVAQHPGISNEGHLALPEGNLVSIPRLNKWPESYDPTKA